MKKLILSALFTLVTCYSFAQDDVYGAKQETTKTSSDSFKASNGVVYKIGDTVKLGRGSNPEGNFRYLEMGGWGAAMFYDTKKGPEQNNIGRGYANTGVVIKKIKQYKIKGISRTYFVVGGGNITNYHLFIEDAIATCEVLPCKEAKDVIVQNLKPSESSLDKLKKLKELFDSGAITKEEYDTKKEKILKEI